MTRKQVIETIRKIEGVAFAYDGCHKIYVLENEKQITKYLDKYYQIHPLSDILETFFNSCDLRFIQIADTYEKIVSQEDYPFKNEYKDGTEITKDLSKWMDKGTFYLHGDTIHVNNLPVEYLPEIKNLISSKYGITVLGSSLCDDWFKLHAPKYENLNDIWKVIK